MKISLSDLFSGLPFPALLFLGTLSVACYTSSISATRCHIWSMDSFTEQIFTNSRCSASVALGEGEWAQSRSDRIQFSRNLQSNKGDLQYKHDSFYVKDFGTNMLEGDCHKEGIWCGWWRNQEQWEDSWKNVTWEQILSAKALRWVNLVSCRNKEKTSVSGEQRAGEERKEARDLGWPVLQVAVLGLFWSIRGSH